jgi:hypothetical protein
MELHLDFTRQYLRSIGNPFELLVQLTLRYTQFVNTVLAVEENLGFVFENYGELYTEIFGQRDTKFCFWRPTFVMWMDKMNEFHDTTNTIYAAILHEDTNKYLKQLL